MLSFNTWVPLASILAASSTTGPLTSYNTLLSLVDFLNSLIFTSPFCLFNISFSDSSSFLFSAWLLFSVSKSLPLKYSVVTPNNSDRNCIILSLGIVLPLTYWLTWLFPNLIFLSAAALTISICLRPFPFMHLFSLSVNKFLSISLIS